MNIIIDEARQWCVGKAWWWRLFLLGLFVPLFWGLLKDPQSYNVFASLNLGIHEMGHLLFTWAGQFMCIAGGTITQLAAPVLGMWNFYVQKDFFGITLCFGWLATNLFNVSTYMNDARTMVLPLVSPFGNGEIKHDWNYLLSHMGLLGADHFFAGIIWFLGICSMLFCFYSSGWLLWQMMVLKKNS